MNILFWNLNGNPIKDYIVSCLSEYNIDIAIFCEYSCVDLNELEVDTGYKYVENIGGCDKITMLVNPEISVDKQFEQSRYILYSLVLEKTRFIVAGIHLEDRRNNSDSAVRLMTIRDIVSDISELEQDLNCDNTIVIGDFNSNPFDKELLQIDAFNAVLFKDIINESETKSIKNTRIKRFYNPMLNYISESKKNYGSYYYNNGINSPIWHAFDQIIVCKSLIDSINDIQYLRKIGDDSLINKVKPNKKISDHLPLLVKLNIGGDCGEQ